jgi:PAS domain S-box-containing protein
MGWPADVGSRTGPNARLEFQRHLDSHGLRFLFVLLIFESAFFVAYKLAMSMTPRTGAPFWLPDSVLLCALLLSRPRNWWIYLAAPLPVRLFVALTPDTPTWFLLAAFANDSLKALLAAALLRRALPGPRIRFDSLREFWIYLACAAAAAPSLSGVAGAASWAPLGHAFWPTWRNWFLGDALANVVLTPLLLCLAADWRRLAQARPLRYLEGAAIFSGLVFAVELAYRRGLNDPSLIDLYDYIPVAFLLLAAVRFGPAGASGSLSIMSLISILATSATQSSSSAPAATDSVLVIQLFLLVIGIPIMSLSVLMEQQHKTEQSLRESETRFRTMADTAPVMIWIADPNKAATFFNRGWLEFTGRDIEQAVSDGWSRCVHPDQRNECLAGYSSSFDARRQWHTECQLRRADGEYRWMLCSGAPRFAPDGVFAGYIVSCSDISDLKNVQEASLARQKLESLGVLSAGIAHDFNNLLGSIHSNAEVAEAVGADGSFPGEEIQVIKALAMRGSEIVRQLMIYAGGEKSDFEHVDLSGLVREMLVLIKVSISKSAVLETDLAKNLPAVLGNGAQIQRVVMNLVLNASDALGGRSGAITVATSLVTGGSGGNFVKLEVSDTGTGITKEAQARIFDPFFTTKFPGRGLGLAVVQGIVRTHNGTIELASVPGQGTTFRIVWPSASQSSEAGYRAASAATLQDTRAEGTVPAIQDEAALRLSISKMRRREGWKTRKET